VAEHRGAPSDGRRDVGPSAAAPEATAGGHVDRRRREAHERSQDVAPALPRACAVRADPHLHRTQSARRGKAMAAAAMLRLSGSAGEAEASHPRHRHRHRRVASGLWMRELYAFLWEDGYIPAR